MDEVKSAWPSAIRYSLITGILCISFSLLFFLISPEDTSNSWILNLVIWITIGVMLVIATNKRRKEDLGGYMRYAQSLGYGMQIILPLAVIMTIYGVIYFTVIDPGFGERLLRKQQEVLASKGLSDEQIDAQISMIAKFQSPGVMASMSLLAYAFQGFIITLITSIFTSKKDPASSGAMDIQ